MKQLHNPEEGTMRVAGFMSGSGSNLRKLIEKQNGYEVKLIFTDTENEDKCNARKIGNEHGIKVESRDIKAYYKDRNSERGDMETRRQYDKETAQVLEGENIKVVALCGYMSIVTTPILEKFTTINVHPADLRVKKDGKRLYAGCMGKKCVKKAMENGDNALRSTVHMVTAGVDEGQILGVSPAVHISEETPEQAQELLKEKGDWVVYPKIMELIAAGRFAMEDNNIYFDGEGVPDGIAVE